MSFQFRNKYLPYYLLAFFGVLMFFMGIMNHYFFRTVTYDYGNYNFAFWDYSHFRISPIPTFRGNFLQDHFSFTLFYFVPVYWLLNWLTGSYTLIIIQNAMILTAAIYTYKIIRLKSENLWVLSGVVIYFFVLFGRYSSFSADVNLAIISACFIPVFIYYFERKKYIVSFVILVLSLLSRENIPLWFVFIFMVLMFNHRRNRKALIWGAIGVVVSVSYFIVLFKIIIPRVESEEVGYALFNYSALGKTPGEALAFIFKHPVETVKLFFVNHLDDSAYNRVKAEFYWVYLVSGGFVLLLKPKYLVWFIPVVAQKVLNDSYVRWGIATYYSVEVVTLLPLSVFLILAEIKKRKLRKGLIAITCIATLATTIHKMDRSNNAVPWTLNPSKIKVYSKDFYTAPFNIKKVNQLLDKIPAGAKVSASTILLPHIAQRRFIYYFPTVRDADYIVFSVFDNNYLFSNAANEQFRQQYLNNPAWVVIEKEFPVFLLQKQDSAHVNQNVNEKLSNQTDTITCNFETLDTVSQHILLSNNQKADTLSNLTGKISHSAEHSIFLTKENPYSHSIRLNNLDSVVFVEISAWSFSTNNNAFIVATGDNNFYTATHEADTVSADGWKKHRLSFWIPQQPPWEDVEIYFWNNGEETVYFDDLTIVKKYE
jgi:uncharacterized membrane protein